MTAEEYNAAEFAAGRLTWAHLTAAIERSQASYKLEADGKAGPMTRARLELETVSDDSVARARLTIGQGTYKLGAGGVYPLNPTPFDTGGRCDCSGFVAWCKRMSRKIPGYAGVGWFYTDAIVMDARGDVAGDLGSVIGWSAALPGDVLVYGSLDTDGDGDRDLIGHCGIVSVADVSGPLRVIHCQARTAPAVVETGPDIWRKRGIVFRFRR